PTPVRPHGPEEDFNGRSRTELPKACPVAASVPFLRHPGAPRERVRLGLAYLAGADARHGVRSRRSCRAADARVAVTRSGRDRAGPRHSAGDAAQAAPTPAGGPAAS